MAALRRSSVDSGQLTDDDKREIKKMFAESLGGGDVDEKIREANKNRDQLDAQAREASDLLNKLEVRGMHTAVPRRRAHSRPTLVLRLNPHLPCAVHGQAPATRSATSEIP